MNCSDAGTAIIEAYDVPGGSRHSPALAAHLASCQDCARFAEKQAWLHTRLGHAVAVAPLKASFRVSLRHKMIEKAAPAWFDWLPDAALVAFCAACTGLCAVLLTFSLPTVLLSGTAIGALVLAGQSEFFGWLEDGE